MANTRESDPRRDILVATLLALPKHPKRTDLIAALATASLKATQLVTSQSRAAAEQADQDRSRLNKAGPVLTRGLDDKYKSMPASQVDPRQLALDQAALKEELARIKAEQAKADEAIRQNLENEVEARASIPADKRLLSAANKLEDDDVELDPYFLRIMAHGLLAELQGKQLSDDPSARREELLRVLDEGVLDALNTPLELDAVQIGRVVTHRNGEPKSETIADFLASAFGKRYDLYAELLRDVGPLSTSVRTILRDRTGRNDISKQEVINELRVAIEQGASYKPEGSTRKFSNMLSTVIAISEEIRLADAIEGKFDDSQRLTAVDMALKQGGTKTNTPASFAKSFHNALHQPLAEVTSEALNESLVALVGGVQVLVDRCQEAGVEDLEGLIGKGLKPDMRSLTASLGHADLRRIKPIHLMRLRTVLLMDEADSRKPQDLAALANFIKAD